MNKEQFLKLMHFPVEWNSYGMYPDSLFQEQLRGYQPGHEDGAEHDRNGAFHWWLRKNPTKEQLMKLTELTFLDPDPMMASDVRRYIKVAHAFDEEVERLIQSKEG